MNPQDWQITNATLATGDAIENTAGLHIVDGKIQAILGGGEEIPELLNLNLHGLSVFPGWINSHDSLLATYEAFRGEGAPYLNWLAFDNQLKASPLFKERMLVGVEDLYRLGAVRNLVAGVTTVADHIPHFVRRPFQDASLPVRLLPDFGISHSICSYSLEWGDGPRAE
ncbi:MAG: hydrolase, partial [Leptospirales bacterium]